MKRLFIPAKSTIPICLSARILKKLHNKGKIGIITTVQYKHHLKDVERQLLNAKALGTILGCSKVAKADVDAYLYIGSGTFHPVNVKLQMDKPVYRYNPSSREMDEIDEDDVLKIQRKKKVGLAKFYSSDTIGILVSTKEGQARMKDAQLLKQKLKKDGKGAYILVFETLDAQFLESFSFIECFVNTACPRIMEDRLPKAVVNIESI